MNAAPNIVIQKMWDITTVTFQDTRLLEGQQLEAIGKELYRLVDQMDRKKLVLDFTKVQLLSSAMISGLLILNTKSKAIKGSFVICGLRQELMKVFEIMKLVKVLKFAPDEGKALTMLGFSGGR